MIVAQFLLKLREPFLIRDRDASEGLIGHSSPIVTGRKCLEDVRLLWWLTRRQHAPDQPEHIAGEAIGALALFLFGRIGMHHAARHALGNPHLLLVVTLFLITTTVTALLLMARLAGITA
jgi:hypothetical protein